MAEILLDSQGNPTAPAAGQVLLYPATSSKQMTSKDENGKALSLPGIKNANTANVVATGVDTYLTGSALAVPAHGLQAGSAFKWRLYMTKSGAGTATPIWVVRVGTLGTVVDTARLTFTGPAQTAVIDTGFVEINAILLNVGAAGVMAGGLALAHNLAATGFANIASPVLQVTSAAFDTTTANLIVGVSVNPGTAGVWTHQLVLAELLNT
jgi:hypothetical protein